MKIWDHHFTFLSILLHILPGVTFHRSIKVGPKKAFINVRLGPEERIKSGAECTLPYPTPLGSHTGCYRKINKNPPLIGSIPMFLFLSQPRLKLISQPQSNFSERGMWTIWQHRILSLHAMRPTQTSVPPEWPGRQGTDNVLRSVIHINRHPQDENLKQLPLLYKYNANKQKG